MFLDKSSLFLLSLSIILIHGRQVTNQNQKSCSININKDLSEPQPILVVPGTNNTILPHDINGIIDWKLHESIEFLCTEGVKQSPELKSLKGTCIDENIILIDGEQYTIKDIACEKNSRAISKTIGSCYQGASLVHIGYMVQNRFIRLIELCFDHKTERTLYAYTHLTKAHATYQKNIKRPGWISGKKYFSNTNINKMYSKENQIERVTELVDDKWASVIITDEINLVRGHLVPKVDFVYSVQQRATMHLLNAAPQWNVINGGNWQRIEESIRKFVETSNVELDIYSGTFGTLLINGREFYLTHNSRNQGVIPVPEFFFKVVLDRLSGNGVAIITVNHPFITDKTKNKYNLCKDISKNITWVERIKPVLTAGYYYACDVNDFVKVVKFLPQSVKANNILM